MTHLLAGGGLGSSRHAAAKRTRVAKNTVDSLADFLEENATLSQPKRLRIADAVRPTFFYIKNHAWHPTVLDFALLQRRCLFCK